MNINNKKRVIFWQYKLVDKQNVYIYKYYIAISNVILLYSSNIRELNY